MYYKTPENIMAYAPMNDKLFIFRGCQIGFKPIDVENIGIIRKNNSNNFILCRHYGYCAAWYKHIIM